MACNSSCPFSDNNPLYGPYGTLLTSNIAAAQLAQLAAASAPGESFSFISDSGITGPAIPASPGVVVLGANSTTTATTSTPTTGGSTTINGTSTGGAGVPLISYARKVATGGTLTNLQFGGYAVVAVNPPAPLFPTNVPYQVRAFIARPNQTTFVDSGVAATANLPTTAVNGTPVNFVWNGRTATVLPGSNVLLVLGFPFTTNTGPAGNQIAGTGSFSVVGV